MENAVKLTLVQCTDQLCNGIAQDPVKVTQKLFAKELVSEAQVSASLSLSQDDYSKASALAQVIRRRVVTPEDFEVFLMVLSECSWMNDAVMHVKKKYAINSKHDITSEAPLTKSSSYAHVSDIEGRTSFQKVEDSSLPTTKNPEPNQLKKERDALSAKQQPQPCTMAKVLYNFDARDDDEMSVQQGELVEILDMEDMSDNAQWLLVKKGDRIGTVPSNYLSIEKQEPAPPSPTNTPSSTKTADVVLHRKESEKKSYANLSVANNPPTSNLASIAMGRSEFKKLLESVVGGGGGRVEPITEQPIPQPVQPVQPTYEVYIALYNYRAADEDEVSFQKGDEALVTTVLDEGWMEGTIRRTGVYGMLPANYFAKQ